MSLEHYRNRVLMKGKTNKERIIYENKRSFEEYFDVAPNSETVEIDGFYCQVIIQDRMFNDELLQDKYLITHIDTPAKVGSLVFWDNEYWIIKTKENESIKSRQSFKMAKTNNTLTFQDPTNPSIIHKIPCILADKTSVYSDGINEGKYLTLADDQISITIPDNELIDSKYLNKRFIFDHDKMYVFEVSKIDKLTQPGLMIIVMKKNDYNPATDRLDINIANYIEPSEQPDPEPIGYTITVDGGDEIMLGDSKVYVAKVYADGVMVDKVVSWSVDDTSKVSIVSIMNNTCTLKASDNFNATGEVKLTAKLVDDENVVCDKWIEIVGLW